MEGKFESKNWKKFFELSLKIRNFLWFSLKLPVARHMEWCLCRHVETSFPMCTSFTLWIAYSYYICMHSQVNTCERSLYIPEHTELLLPSTADTQFTSWSLCAKLGTKKPKCNTSTIPCDGPHRERIYCEMVQKFRLSPKSSFFQKNVV